MGDACKTGKTGSATGVWAIIRQGKVPRSSVPSLCQVEASRCCPAAGVVVRTASDLSEGRVCALLPNVLGASTFLAATLVAAPTCKSPGCLQHCSASRQSGGSLIDVCHCPSRCPKGPEASRGRTMNDLNKLSWGQRKSREKIEERSPPSVLGGVT